jgi:two-component system, chemotaxis family, sensor kinase CheA
VIAESMIHRHLGELGNDVAREAAQLNKITRNLQQLSLSLRMVPLRGTFQKMARLVRDVAKKVDKPVDFQCYGEDTELDKTVVDQIGDPLVHMIRNSVDHGIESPSERLEKGKPAHGTVTLRAFHRGGNIYIEIEDDGRGLDPRKILAKGREKGLVSPEAQLTDAEILDLIFTPGFSTAEQLTDLSGRGVGMDVVRRNVEAMRGSIELRSTLGRGTCFMLRLPLTLAIIDGMVVRVGQQRYVIPTLSIVELLRPRADDVLTICERGEYLNVRDQQIVMLRADELLESAEARVEVDQGIVVLVEAVGTTAGLLVDEVLGQQQAVIKKLGGRLDEQLGLSGGAIMPDGTVGLILDIQGLLQLHNGKPLSEALALC